MATNSFKVKNSLVLTPRNLSTLTTPEAGDLACDINDSNKIKRYDASIAAWVEVGSGGVGGVDILYVQDFESTPITQFIRSSGFSLVTSNPLHDKISAQIIHSAGSEYFGHIFPVNPKFRGQTINLTLDCKTSATGQLYITVYDNDTDEPFLADTKLNISNSVSGTKSTFTFAISSSVENLRYDIISVGNSGAITIIDDIIFEISNPLVTIPQPDTEVIEALTSTSTFGSTNTGVPVLNITKNTNKGIISVDSTSVLGTSFRALKKCTVNISVTARDTTTAATAFITRNSTILTTATPNGILSTLSLTAGFSGSASSSVVLDIGDILRVQRDATFISSIPSVTLTATASSDQILTAPESFSTDTASLTYASSSAYTLSTLQNAPVGTYITFTYAANTNTRTQTTTRPTQTDADMNVNGMQVFTRAYNAASTAASPAAVAIQIGKGLKGKSLDLYKSAGKVTSGSLDYVILTNDTAAYGAGYKEYNEVTGVLIIDAAAAINTNTARTFVYSDGSTVTSGYLVINASKSPALTGVPLLLPRIATLSDVKASGTAGGTATSGSYQTRTLNTLSDPSGIVTSLASNQFTLPAGEYYIEAEASAFGVVEHKAKIRNITNSSDSLMGTSEYSNTTSTTGTKSSIKGSIVITSSTVFEIQHRVNSTKATNGFGTNSSFGDNEVYSILKIQKIK
jgi:hypothetical protein